MVIAENLGRDYKSGSETVHALINANFKCDDNSITLFMGPSGSGKTTALRIIGGELSPSFGSVTANGFQLEKMNENELCSFRYHEVGMIFQDFMVLDYLTVFDNVLLSVRVNKKEFRKKEKYYHEKAVNILENLGLEKEIKRLASDLSGGQRQRVSIARALLKSPSILLADEPTANLDKERAIEIMELFSNLTHKNGVTTIISTHDERLLEFSNKVYKFENGYVCEDEEREHIK